MVGGCVDTVQVGILTAPVGPATAQVSGTFAVNPPLGVTVTGTWIDPPRQPIVNELPVIENDAPLDPMTYAALAVRLVPKVLLMAIALMVMELATGMGVE